MQALFQSNFSLSSPTSKLLFCIAKVRCELCEICNACVILGDFCYLGHKSDDSANGSGVTEVSYNTMTQKPFMA